MHRNRTAAASGLVVVFMLACSAPMLATPTPIPTATSTATLTPTSTPTATPTFTPTPLPVLISSGTLVIRQSYQADLDSGSIPTDPKSPAYADVDLWFDAITSVERYLEPYNGASMLVMGPAEVGVEQCRGIQAAVARADLLTLPIGTYICVVTNIQNISVVRVSSIDYPALGTITLDFKTWHQP